MKSNMKAKFELVEYNTGSLYVARRVKKISSELHWHREIEIVYVIHGSLDVRVDKKEFSAKDRQMVLINANQIHSINDDSNVEGDFFLLQINEQLLKNLRQDSKQFRLTTLIDREDEEVSPEAAEEVFSDMDKIVEEAENNSDPTKVNTLSLLLLSALIKNFGTVQSELVMNNNDNQYYMVKKIIDYISNNYASQDLNQADAAKKLGLSAGYLSRLFSAYTNTSFVHYLNTYRIDNICYELLSTKDTVTEIYLRNGFSNGKTFNRVFKAITGVSPREYRSDLSKSRSIKINTDRTTSTSVGSYVNYADTSNRDTSSLQKDFLVSDTGIKHSQEAMHHITRSISASILSPTSQLKKPAQKLLCTGRAFDILLAPWREQFEMCLAEMRFDYLRFHGLFNDEMGIIYRKGQYSDYNFYYVDKAIAYLLEHGVRPYIELSFMPSTLASKPDTVFVYRANISMPREIEEWEKLLDAFIQHVIRRFGREEVTHWYFEVWNEPDIDEFWANTYEEYLLLYRVSYKALKKADMRLKVGGPASSSVMFQKKTKFFEFLDYCKEHRIYPDFVSLHPYPAIFMKDDNNYEELQKVCDVEYTRKNMTWVNGVMKERGLSNIPVHMNEWNSSPRFDDYTHDTAYMATYVISTVLSCSNLCDVLGWWTLSDLFDEGGVVYKEFGGGFGLLNRDGLKKPAYWGMWALNKLCDSVIEEGEDYIITRDEKHIAVLIWNYAFCKDKFAEGDRSGLSYYNRYDIFDEVPAKKVQLTLTGFHSSTLVINKYSFSRRHGSIYDFWINSGAMEYLNSEQLKMLKENNHLRTASFVKSNIEELILEEEIRQFGFALYDITFLE